MDSDDDMLDDMLDDMDLDDMLDEALDSVSAQTNEEEEKRNDNLLMLQISDPMELRACTSLNNMKEWKEWDAIIKKDVLKQQGLGRKKPFSHRTGLEMLHRNRYRSTAIETPAHLQPD